MSKLHSNRPGIKKTQSLNEKSPRISQSKSSVNVESFPQSKSELVSADVTSPAESKRLSSAELKRLSSAESKRLSSVKSTYKSDTFENVARKFPFKEEKSKCPTPFNLIVIIFVVLILMGMVIAVIVVCAFMKPNSDDGVIDAQTTQYSSQSATTEASATTTMEPDSFNKSLSTLCQEFLGPCYYHPLKYLRNCQRLVCSSVFITPAIIYSNFTDRNNFYATLSFVSNNFLTEVEDIPDGYPCMDDNDTLVGMCENKTCKYKDQNLTDIVNGWEPINGGWGPNPKPMHDLSVCISNPFRRNDTQYLDEMVIWRLRYLGRHSCSNVLNLNLNSTPCRYYQFRSCINPVPKFGGKVCWSQTDSNETLSFDEWPLTLSSKCSNCNEPRPLSKADCESPGEKLQCKPNQFSISDASIGTDFAQCCVRHAKYGNHEGRCIVGTCVPLNVSHKGVIV